MDTTREIPSQIAVRGISRRHELAAGATATVVSNGGRERLTDLRKKWAHEGPVGKDENCLAAINSVVRRARHTARCAGLAREIEVSGGFTVP